MALPNVRQMYVDAALSEDGKSRVEASQIRDAIAKALADPKTDLSLRSFSSGSVGAQVRVKVPVKNDAGDEFVLTGQVLLTIPETVVKKA